VTNLQLLLSIGIPSLLIVLSWLQQGSRIGRLESALNRHADSVVRRFESIRSEMVALRDSIHRDMVALHERVAVVEAKQNS
jgi:hypothetical protein